MDQDLNEGSSNITALALLPIALSIFMCLCLCKPHKTSESRHRRPAVAQREAVQRAIEAPGVGQGLDSAAIAALPTFNYRPTSSPAEECVVCLIVPEGGEAVRMLPRCAHAFHVECINAWLRSHSTCPVCRAAAKLPQTEIEIGELLAAPPMPERFHLERLN